MAKSKARTSTKRAGTAKGNGGARTQPAASARAANEPKPAFTPDDLESTVIALPLLNELKDKGTDRTYDVIVDVNRDYPGGRDKAQQRIKELINELIQAHGVDPKEQGVHARKTAMTSQYVFGRLRGDLIQALVRKDREAAARKSAPGERKPALYRIWPDFMVSRMTYRSVATVKADAARNAFAASGQGIVWAVLDSGIEGGHPHFRTHKNLELPAPLRRGAGVGHDVRDRLARREDRELLPGGAVQEADVVAGHVRGAVAEHEPGDHEHEDHAALPFRHGASRTPTRWTGPPKRLRSCQA